MNKFVKLTGIFAVLLASASCSWLGLNKSPAPGKEQNPLIVPPIYNQRPEMNEAGSTEARLGEASSEEVNELNQEIDREIQKLKNAQ